MTQPIYVVDGARTPFLKARNRPGPFAASDLAVQAGRELLMRQSFAPMMSGFVGVYNFRPDISNLTTLFDDLVMTASDPVPTNGRTWGNLKALYR